MIGRKTMEKLQKRRLRVSGAKLRIEPDRPGFPGNDYDSMYSEHIARYQRNTGGDHKSKSLILK